MATRIRGVPVGTEPQPRRLLRRAWISVGLIPVALILGLFLGEVVYRLAGYEPMATVPLWVDVGSWVASSVVFSIPFAAALMNARRTVSAGNSRGWVPLIVASVLGLGFLVMSVATVATSTHL